MTPSTSSKADERSSSPANRPKPGDERILLFRGGPELYIVERQVLVEGGWSTYYDKASEDFVSYRGTWVRVETLGRLKSRKAARDFMLKREAEPLPSEPYNHHNTGP